MYSISKETNETKKEIEIRGRYLMMSCDIEFCLLSIIMYSNPDPFNHERVGEFKRMQMKNKIDSAICDLKKYKPQYYTKYKKYFDGLEEFRQVRNDMAHHKGDFPNNPDLAIFKILFIDEYEGEERIKFKEYTTQYIEESINRFAEINRNLSDIWILLKMEFDSKNHPLVK